ncbi:MAG: rhamnulokinase [Clostridia bacterium]|nr:rhamnulokinase [Clostridia bacterium]
MKGYLAVDIGASSGRHIMAWLEGGLLKLEEVYRFPNGAEMKNGHLCWDMDALYAHVVAGMHAAKEKGFAPIAMGIDTWAVDFVLLDESDRPVGDLVAYRDSRTQGMDKALEKTYPFEQLYARTGIAKQPFNTVYQMMAVLREHPEYRETVRDFLMVPEYLAFRLTGRKMHEWTNASTTALCDARTKQWSPEVIHAAGLPAHWFAGKIHQPGAVVGSLLREIREAVGFDTDVILTATHDTGSAYLAVPARDDQAAFLSSGTWSLLGTELDAACATQESRAAGFTNEGGYGGTTRYLKNIMGLWMLQCIRKELDDAYTFAEMADMAAASDYDAYVDAADNRFLAPANMLDEVKAALREAGAPAPRNLADVLRTVNLSLAMCYRDAIDGMSRLTGKQFTSVNIVGGGSQNQLLNSLTAQMTGLSVYAGPTEGTAIGNLIVQMIAKGEFTSLQEARDTVKKSFDIKEVSHS